MPLLARLLPLALLSVACAQPLRSAETAAAGLLGSATYVPTPERPVGWRGDGSGRYPAATPPTAWGRTRTGSGYQTRNILWATPLPNGGVSCPIIVGNRIYLTCEPTDVVCLDKASGQLLWIRSNLECEGLGEEERKAIPAFAEKIAPLLPQLAKANADLVAAINAKQAGAAAAAFQPVAGMDKKRELEKQIADQQLAIDKKKFERYWAQAVFGFAGQTAVSDGKKVCAFFTTGVSACYDLDGNRTWITRGSGGGSEHGNFASPLICSNQFVVWANEMRGYDIESGKLLWSNPAKANNSYGSLFRLQVAGEWVAAFQSGFFTHLKDGKAIWGDNIFGDSVTTPIVEGGLLFATIGYPRNNEGLGLHAFNVPTSIEGRPASAYTVKVEWGADEMPVVEKKSPFDRGYVASPLFYDGLLYQVTQGGGLTVNDASNGALVYRKVLPLKPKTEYWNWAGVSCSPTLAGKLIYLMDNQGTTVVLQPGKAYKEVQQNLIEESKDGKSQEQNVSTPIFEGSRMYYRTPNYLYCIADK
jgi:hypothetical protein